MIPIFVKTLSPNIVSLIAILLFASCTTGPKISNEINPEVDLNSLNSFALLPLSLPGADSSAIIRYGKAAQDGLKNALTAKGYSESDLANADFTVNLKATVVAKVDVTNWGYDYGHYGRQGSWGSGNMGTIDVDNYEDGTLIIEIFETESKQLAWVGWAKGRKKSKGMTRKELRDLIATVLESFPTK